MDADRLLPLPRLALSCASSNGISYLTDEALFAASGIRIAFTGRLGGVSEGVYRSLNLGMHVGDDPVCVQKNRSLLMEALGASDAIKVLVPTQVHGNKCAILGSFEPYEKEAAPYPFFEGSSRVFGYECAADVEGIERILNEGADSLVITQSDIAALLCFADCVPVILASPTGNFAVVHAGWRGVEGGVVANALSCLTRLDHFTLGSRAASCYNAYIGPHIHVECFEVGEEVRALFRARFAESVIDARGNVDQLRAITLTLLAAGFDERRIVDAGQCTKCHPDTYFSYRASSGLCGRHGACAFRVGHKRRKGGEI